MRFDEDDLDNFNAEKRKLIKTDAAKQVSGEESKASKDEADLLKSLFVTHADDAVEEFEQEKDQEVATQIGKSVQRTTIKQGWGSWAGDGVDNSRQEAQQKRLDSIRQKKIE